MIELTPRGDARGRFTRLFCEKEISQIEWTKHIVNVNASVTQLKGTIRGMHFQKPPKAEVKIVRCVRGAVYDVIVDIRKDSPTFLQHIGVELTDSNDRMLYIPEGFAHGFQTLTDDVEFMYFVTEFYSSEQEGGLRYNDPRLAISWKLEPTEISLRDRNHPLLDNDFTGLNISVLSTIPDNYHFAI
jgi:dTDP-4-dehydrorhamnose 3,5-epimerase